MQRFELRGRPRPNWTIERLARLLYGDAADQGGLASVAGFLSSRKAGVTSHAGDWSAVRSRIGPNGFMGSNRHTKLPAFCGKNETQGVPRPEISECLGLSRVLAKEIT